MSALGHHHSGRRELNATWADSVLKPAHKLNAEPRQPWVLRGSRRRSLRGLAARE